MFYLLRLLEKFEKNKKGFTLIELIVVMAIIAVLVLLAAPRFIGYTKDANVAAMKQDARVIEDAVMQYHIKEGHYPLLTNDGEPLWGDLNDPNPFANNATAVRSVPGTDTTAVAIDYDEINSYINNIKNEDVYYYLVIGGDYDGRVVDIEGVEDRNGVTHYGLDLNDELPDVE